MKAKTVLASLAVTAAVAAGTVPVLVAGRSSASVTSPCSYRSYGALPDKSCTPGATNPDVTQASIQQTICKSGWTATVRPPLSVTEPQKIAAIQRYGAYFGSNLNAYEYDHLIPLELGGAPDDPLNLWPEPASVRGGYGSFDKDGTEAHLNALVCDGKMPLATAQAFFESDWRKGIRYTP